MQKIIIFDMDGTLIDSKKDITVSINHVREIRHNLPPLSEAFVVEAINMEVRNLPKLFYGTETYEKPDMIAFESHYEQQCTQSPYLYDGILEMLERLKDENVNLSVATNAPTKFALRMLSSLGVAKHFDEIVGADRVSASKPSPEMITKILDVYKYDKSRDMAWMVGDNSKDMLSAKNAGIDALFATWGFTPDAQHHTLLSHPSDLMKIVL
ncbi:MAG: HAD family hydrolase [Campylobacterales bacterium]|nr:HAD family hydrolase [Campylobacterales bacterium]